MVKLLAKNQVDGRYYFIEGDNIVYLIKPPLMESKKEYVDPLPVFARKSLDSDLVYESAEFQSIDELRAFAAKDSLPGKRGVALSGDETYEDLLEYAPTEIVEDYFEMIDDMIKNKEFIGIDMFFKQLARNYELKENEVLTGKLNGLRADYDAARFPSVVNMETAIRATIRIQKKHGVLSLCA